MCCSAIWMDIVFWEKDGKLFRRDLHYVHKKTQWIKNGLKTGIKWYMSLRK